MRYEEIPTSCGVKKHPPECLCDVVITEPVPVMENWATDSFMARELIKHLDLSAPWTNEKILELLTAQTHVHDDLVEMKRREQAGTATVLKGENQKLRPGQVAAAEALCLQGYSHGQVRTAMLETYGIELERSHAAKIRDRVYRRMLKAQRGSQ
jgi:hypothetical protein